MTEISVDSEVTTIQDTPPAKQYFNPYWSNKENRHLIVTIKFPNGKESMASIQDKDGTNPDMIAVLQQFTEEEIDENTQRGLDRRNARIKQQAERREAQQSRAKQEALFAAKLSAFEIDAVKELKNTKLKRLIRKSKSIMEVQAYCSILLMQEIENAEEESN